MRKLRAGYYSRHVRRGLPKDWVGRLAVPQATNGGLRPLL